MPQLCQHPVADVWAPKAGSVKPGAFVEHIGDESSFGMVVARVGDECEVLWSRSPVLSDSSVQISNINSQSRRLNAIWTVTDESRWIGESSFLRAPRRPSFEVEEEFERLDYDEIRRLHEAGANVQLHEDGRVTVKRSTFTPPSEHELRNSHVIRRKVSF